MKKILDTFVTWLLKNKNTNNLYQKLLTHLRKMDRNKKTAKIIFTEKEINS